MAVTCSTVVRSSLVSKPPMVVFVACLLAFAFTTLSLSLYVSHSDNIPNPDVLSWNSLLVRISKLDFCLKPSSASPQNLTSSPSPTEQTVAISVPISPKFLDEFRSSAKMMSGEAFLARGEIPISKLGRHLSRYEGQKIALSFQISADVEKKSDVCLSVVGPTLLISDLNLGNSPDNCSSDVASRNVTQMRLASHSQDETVSADWCDASARNETPMVLEFVEQSDWAVYVTAKDKEMMQLHLLVTSVFILALLLTVFLGVLLRNLAAFCSFGSGYSAAGTDDESRFLPDASSVNISSVERG